MSKVERFLELMAPDENGVSRVVTIDELAKIGITFGNGGGTIRDDGPVGQMYKVRKTYGPRNTIVTVQLIGFNNERYSQSVPAEIRRYYEGARCRILDIGGQFPIEIDHAIGVKKWYEMGKPVTVDDFQPLSQAANKAKRTHCKQCKETGVRYDATRLGYTVSQTKTGTFDNPCAGCYWHNPREFNREVSNGVELRENRTYVFKNGRLQQAEIEL